MKRVKVFVVQIVMRAIRFIEEVIILFSIKHLHGPMKIQCGRNEAIVLCVVRAGAGYLESFLQHYFLMGVKHVVLLDNGSKDETVELAKTYEHVTILSSDVSLSKNYSNELLLKTYLINRFGRRRWCFLVDIDEFFDYPFSDTVPLNALLQYLTQHSFTAVVAQMLDMFSDIPLDKSGGVERSPISLSYRYYDISDIIKHNYFYFCPSRSDKLIKDNILSNLDIKFLTGGIRKKVFGTDNWLTKHPLIWGGRVKITHPHCVSHARCADFSAVCFHYKLISSFYQTALRYAKERYACYKEYVAIVSKFQNTANVVFKQDTARELKSVNDLIENGFLVVSPQYDAFAQPFAHK